MSLYERSKAKYVISDRNRLRELVSSTMNDMANTVGATLGPGGRVVLIERDALSPLITKDGVTVAKSLGVGNAEANVIVEAAKEICIKTGTEAGDGTTTAIVLANALSQHGLSFLKDNPKYNPQRMVTELHRLYEDVMLPYLRSAATKVNAPDELISVATISANGDTAIAKAAVDAVMSAGDDGKVLVEEAQGSQIRVENMDGFVVTTGLKEIGQLGPSFINDRSNYQVQMDNGLVFLYDGSMNDLKVPAIIQQEIEGSELYGKPIMVFAHKFSDVVIEKFSKTTKGGYTVVPVQTPMTGVPNSQTLFLHDLAAYCGATIYDPINIDQALENDDVSFGRFLTAKVNMFETLLTCDVDPDRIEARVTELKSLISVAPVFDKMHLQAALARLTGGISTIWVGGATQIEAREKKARAEDAVEAVRSAIAEGIVPGGCAMHLAMVHMLNDHPDRKPSWDIMLKALMAPFETLLQNCGEDPADVWTALSAHVIGCPGAPRMIFDAQSHTLVDPVVSGIIEPAKVVRVSIGNALSVASLLITLGGVVVTPRDAQLENQLELSKTAFRDMMNSGGVGQA